MRFLTGLALGAGVTYFFDSRQGKRRRAVFQDKAARMAHDAECLFEAGTEDLKHRAQGLRAKASHPLRRGRRGQRMELMQENWAPAIRLLAGAAGGALLLWGAARKRMTAALIGAGLFARAAANRPILRVIGLQHGRLIDLHKTITVHAPRGEVFRFWRAFANFPRFMQHVAEVQVRDGRSHWVVAGPAGVPVEWDAELTSEVPDELITWRTLPGGQVEHSGAVRFEDAPDGGTRIDIRMTYDPPAGVLGHAVAALFHADPKHAMDEDMVRMKSLLEQGKTTAHGARVTREDLLKPDGT